MPKIPEHIIDQIRNSVDIVDLISRYLSLKKQGKNYKANCPFHTEKTPSFTVSPEKQIFYCFGCGAGGNVINFIMRYEKISFVEAVTTLSKETGIKIPQFKEDSRQTTEYDRLYRANQFAADHFSDQLNLNFHKLEDYLSGRQLSKETLNFFKIGFVPDEWSSLYQRIQRSEMSAEPFLNTGLLMKSEKDSAAIYDRFRNRLMFPIHNHSGRIVAFGGRTLSGDPSSPKYINSPESLIYKKSQILYGLHFSKDWIRSEGYVIFVEGYMDFLQLFQNNIKHVVATSGTALTADHANIIKRYTSDIVLCYDADEAGIRAAIRGGQILFQNDLKVKILILPEGEDPDSYVIKKGRSAFYSLIEKCPEFFEFYYGYLSKQIDFKDISQRTGIVNELIESIAAHKDPMKRNFYVNFLAEKFNLQESILMEEVNKKHSIFRSRDERSIRRDAAVQRNGQSLSYLTGAWSAEKDIIVILLKHFDDVKNAIFQLLEPEDFSNEEFRKVFILIRDHRSKTVHELFHFILGEIENEKITGLLAADMFKEILNPDRYLNDCIQQMKVARYKSRIIVLQNRLKQTSEDDQETQSILEQIKVNMQKIREIRNIFKK